MCQNETIHKSRAFSDHFCNCIIITSNSFNNSYFLHNNHSPSLRLFFFRVWVGKIISATRGRETSDVWDVQNKAAKLIVWVGKANIIYQNWVKKVAQKFWRNQMSKVVNVRMTFSHKLPKNNIPRSSSMVCFKWREVCEISPFMK